MPGAGYGLGADGKLFCWMEHENENDRLVVQIPPEGVHVEVIAQAVYEHNQKFQHGEDVR